MDSNDRGRGREGWDRARGNFRERGSGGKNKKRNMGRGEWSRSHVDKRARNNDEHESKRRKVESMGEGAIAVAISSEKEEVEKEERKPKRKVAVMIGYSGSGYKGMQLNATEKTIEGDIFAAFVAAGAISKANADDPKKSSLVRCARTDKGVHAAGNVISLKLIIEDPEIVQKINHELSPQIRVWGIERTNASFSCYQACDSRVYEYLIPTHAFLPPHPHSYLGRKIVELAEAADDSTGLRDRQEEVSNFWQQVEASEIEPILAKLDPPTRDLLNKALYDIPDDTGLSHKLKPQSVNAESKIESVENTVDAFIQQDSHNAKHSSDTVADESTLSDNQRKETECFHMQDSVPEIASPDKVMQQESEDTQSMVSSAIDSEGSKDASTGVEQKVGFDAVVAGSTAREIEAKHLEKDSQRDTDKPRSTTEHSPLDNAIRAIKAAYTQAKKSYRIPASRLARVQSALDHYIGTRNFHNYTVDKAFRDPSAKRVIKSFKVAETPIIINDTEWLSLKVHGQSFMMHQIRKMVSMAALVVRCGCSLDRIPETYREDYVSIPKAPGLGLLLERPVFDSYNERAVSNLQREKIDFGIFDKEIEAFKQQEIYQRIFREEEQDNHFHAFFSGIDNYPGEDFLYLTSAGMSAAKKRMPKRGKAATVLDSGSENEGINEQEAGEGQGS